MVLGCLLFFAESVRAQFSGGSVIMHSDPRLAVLLKNNPTAAPIPTHERNPEALSEGKTRADAKNKKKETGHVLTSEPVLPGVKPVTDKETASLESGPVNMHHSSGTLIHREGKVIYTGKGYRVQIYNGYDREKAIKVRAEFMKLYPGTYTYLSYVSPCFRVKVGDYRSRAQAIGMLKEANSMYPSPCMIVPDQITVHAD
jgi:hypothetical protein